MSYFDQISPKSISAIALAALISFADTVAASADTVEINETVDIFASGDDDIVAIGGEVAVSGRAGDELVAIGGVVEIDADVEGDAVVLGGEVVVSGTFDSEVVVIGGTITFSGATSEELIAMGGEIEISEEAVIGGPGRVFGGEIILAGSFTDGLVSGGGELSASGQFVGSTHLSAQMVNISGTFSSDVEVEGEYVTIEDDATFNGTLTIRSPNVPATPDQFDIPEGYFVYEKTESYDPGFGDLRVSDLLRIATGLLVGLGVFLLVLLGAAYLIVVSSGRIARESSSAIKQQPLKSFLVGLLASFAAGFVGVVLLIIVIGPVIPIVFGFIGFFIAGYALCTLMFRKVGEPLEFGQRAGYTFLGGAILILIVMVPLVGLLFTGLATIFGMGAFTLALFGAAPKLEEAFIEAPNVEAYDDRHPPEPDFQDDIEDESREDLDEKGTRS
jgi:hypothetical protein